MEEPPRRVPFLKKFKNLLGAGPRLLLLGIIAEGVTLVLRPWISIPLSWRLESRIALSLLCIAIFLSGMLWFHQSLNLIQVHLRDGEKELISRGPFSYVRHPLYATLILTVPPLAILWFSDLLFLLPWAAIILLAHPLLAREERGLTEQFGEAYREYRRYVPALIPFKGAAGRRYRRDDPSRGSDTSV